MGTHSILAYKINNETKYHYNHFDGYPSDMGLDLANCLYNIIRNEQLTELKTKVSQLQTWDEDGTPSS